jgi:serine/threonine protein kinase
LPSFTKDEFSNITCIGKSTFGKVFRVTKGQKYFVIKEQACVEASEHDKKLFIKEAQMLKALRGHDNIVSIEAFSERESSILMEFVVFDFKRIVCLILND